MIIVKYRYTTSENIGGCPYNIATWFAAAQSNAIRQNVICWNTLKTMQI
jgi:hypothetical protein